VRGKKKRLQRERLEREERNYGKVSCSVQGLGNKLEGECRSREGLGKGEDNGVRIIGGKKTERKNKNNRGKFKEGRPSNPLTTLRGGSERREKGSGEKKREGRALKSLEKKQIVIRAKIVENGGHGRETGEPRDHRYFRGQIKK